jgi:hypothetical protein
MKNGNIASNLCRYPVQQTYFKLRITHDIPGSHSDDDVCVHLLGCNAKWTCIYCRYQYFKELYCPHSEMMVHTYKSTQHFNPEDGHWQELHSQRFLYFTLKVITCWTSTCIVSIREKVAGGRKYGASPVSHEDVGSPVGTRLLYLHTVGPWLPNSGFMGRYWKSHRSKGTHNHFFIIT